MLTERRMVLSGPRLLLTAEGRLSRMSEREGEWVRRGEFASGSAEEVEEEEDSKAMGWWWKELWAER